MPRSRTYPQYHVSLVMIYPIISHSILIIAGLQAIYTKCLHGQPATIINQPTKFAPRIPAPLSCLRTCLTLFREPTVFPKCPWKWTDINAACRRIHWTTSLKWTLLYLSSYACEREYVYVGVWGCCTSFVCPLYCIHWLIEVMNIHNRFGLHQQQERQIPSTSG